MAKNSFTRRLFIIMFAKLVVFIVILSRLFTLQVYNNQYFSRLSRRNAAGSVFITPPRGNIYDRNKNPIVTYTVKWRLLYLFNRSKVDIEAIIKQVSQFVNLSQADIERIRDHKISTSRSVVVKLDLSETEMVQASVFLKESDGFYTIPFYKRVYNYPYSSSSIIGYVKYRRDLQDYYGEVALESRFNDIFYGTRGRIQFQKDAEGNIVNHLGVVNPKEGGSIQLTINAQLQQEVYEIISKFGASCIITDITTGEFLTLTSSPSFDSNRLSGNVTSKDWNELVNNPASPLVNKAISGLYPPGSVIKPIIAYAALEKGIIDDKTTFNCEGYLDFGGNRFHCWTKHNRTDIYKSLAQSCDVFYYQIALELGIDGIADIASRFGFEETCIHNIFSQERKGNIPKRKSYEKWYTGNTINASIGQGMWLVTPMQIHNMTTILAGSGSKHDFTLISKVHTDGKDFVYSQKPAKQVVKLNEEYLQIVRKGLYQSVNMRKGTARRIGITHPNFDVVGKTGTAQVRRITLEQRKRGYSAFGLPARSRDHGLFTCYFPYKNPKYAITVVVEHGISAGATAVPFTAQIIKSLVKHEGFSRDS